MGRRIASETSDPNDKARLIHVTQFWQRLSEQAEKNRRTDLVYETPPKKIAPEIPPKT